MICIEQSVDPAARASAIPDQVDEVTDIHFSVIAKFAVRRRDRLHEIVFTNDFKPGTSRLDREGFNPSISCVIAHEKVMVVFGRQSGARVIGESRRARSQTAYGWQDPRRSICRLCRPNHGVWTLCGYVARPQVPSLFRVPRARQIRIRDRLIRHVPATVGTFQAVDQP